jgi:glycosyltransferase involved in cell wall biosynthesis
MIKKIDVKKKLVSVIVNCHNGQKYLNDAIQSIVDQKYQNWEIIFWDNHSKDKSKKILKSFKDKRIRYFYSKKFTNLHQARNLAIKKARGEFISFLDTDDIWESNKLHLQIEKFKKKKVNFVYGNCWLLNKDYIFKKKNYSNSNLPSGYILNKLLKKYVIPLPTIMIRRSVLKKLRYCFNEKFKIIGDFDLSVRLSVKNIFECVQEPIAYHRIHDGSFSVKNRFLEIRELSTWLKLAKKGGLGEEIKKSPNLKFVSRKIDYLKAIYNYNKNKNFIKSVVYLIKNLNQNNLKILLKVFTPKYLKKKFSVYGQL